MALNFPNSPTNGQLYTDSASGNRWVWDSGNTCWVSTSTFTQTITVASSAPGSPVTGQLWWNKDYGRLLVYYTDDNTSQWVDASPSDYTGQLAYGVANAAFAKANNALANTSGVSFNGNFSVPSGNVGIGTSSPGTFGKFAVQTQAANQPTVAIGAPAGSLSPQLNHYISDSTSVIRNLNQIAFYTGSSDISNYQGYMTFSTMPSAGTLTERVRIDNTGNMGVGTSSPLIKLDVNGGMRVQSISNPASGSGMELSYDSTQGVIQAFTNRATLATAPIYFSGGQIKFPPTQNASSDANTLDDYEEGTFTPTLSGVTTAGTTTYTTQQGSYTKIGRQVTISIRLTYSAATGTGEYRVGGFPFTVSNDSMEYIAPLITSNLNWGGGSYIQVYVIPNTTQATLFYCADDGGWGVQQMVNESAEIRFTATYFV